MSAIELTQDERRRLQVCVDQAAKPIARLWPLRTFIYRNALQGLESLPFDEAVQQGRTLLGGRGYLANADYRRFYQQGRITDGAIREALRRSGLIADEAPFEWGTQRVEAIELLRLHLLHGFDPTDESAFAWQVRREEALTRYRDDVPIAVRKAPPSEVVSALWSGVRTALHLDDPLATDGATTQDEASAPVTPEVLRRRCQEEIAQIGRAQTVGEWLQRLTDTPVVEPVNEQMIKWCGAFLDEGMAVWPMPSREQGFYTAWRTLASADRSLKWLAGRHASDTIRQLPDSPDAALVGCLRRLGVREETWADYLGRHLAQLPGWAGFIKWRATEPDYSWQHRYPIDLIDYLAVRLFYEAELVDALCRQQWTISGSIPAIRDYFEQHPTTFPQRPSAMTPGGPGHAHDRLGDAWRLFHLAQHLGLTADALRATPRETIDRALALLDRMPTEQRGAVWLEALELAYRQRLLDMLSSRRSPADRQHTVPPSAQAVFCIDVRSEPLRRQLEQVGVNDTFGYAGFFGVPICYRPYGTEEEQLLCPAMIKPTQVIIEQPRRGQEASVRRHESGAGWHHLGQELFHALKSNNLTAYVIIDLLGGLFGLSFLGKTVTPTRYQRLKAWLQARLAPAVATEPLIDRPADAERDPSLANLGFTLGEQAAFVEDGLRMIGLTANFARIVLLCAHGSTTENNPYAAAYDCGACGGNHGGPNARVLATMANKPAVRQLLRERAITIPEETLFLAAEHNTTTDRVMLLDVKTIPATHQADVARLAADLDRAGQMTVLERVARLPDAPRAISSEAAVRHAERRSADWSQVRPEWGLSGNAAFIVAPRRLTRALDLGGRVFLHSYDHEQDERGNALETIMTAPLFVVQWISMEYYFSTTDPWIYGSGSKVLHNVTGGIGVMHGRHGDLRPGLPLQSLFDGQSPYHEPMRPLVLIAAPLNSVQAIIERHETLQHLFDHQWMRLLVLDRPGEELREYRSGVGWQTVTPKGAAP